jgi:hypothetical protein
MIVGWQLAAPNPLLSIEQSRANQSKGEDMEPTNILPIVAVLSLVTVEYGGWALLSFISGREGLGDWQKASSEPGTPTPASSSCSHSSTGSTCLAPTSPLRRNGSREVCCSQECWLSPAASSSTWGSASLAGPPPAPSSRGQARS